MASSRQTRHVYVHDANGSHVRPPLGFDVSLMVSHSQWIISSLATRQDTQVIRIDPLLGGISYSGSPGSALFPNYAHAQSWLFVQAGSVQFGGRCVPSCVSDFRSSRPSKSSVSAIGPAHCIMVSDHFAAWRVQFLVISCRLEWVACCWRLR